MNWRGFVATPPILLLISVWLLAVALTWVVEEVMVPLTEWGQR